MKTAILAALIASSMVGAGAATLAVNLAGADASPLAAVAAGRGHDHPGAEAGADEHALHGGMAGDAGDAGGGHGAHAQTGMKRPSFPPAEGSVPSASDAERLEEVPS